MGAALAIAATTVAAAELKLGPETPLAPVEIVPATGLQRTPTASSNGRDFLVAWQDGRRSGADVFLTRVGIDGRPADPLGRHVGGGSSPKLAWGPGGYLLAYSSNPFKIILQLLDDDGAPKSAPVTVNGEGPRALVSSGTTYLLASSEAYTILDLDGVPRQTVGPQPGSFSGAGVRGNRYVVADAAQEGHRLHSIGDDGSIVTTIVSALTTPLLEPRVAAFGTNEILIASVYGQYAIVGYDGSIVKESRFTLASSSESRNLAAARDGNQFLLAFRRDEAFRIAADGTVVDAQPLVLSNRPVTGLTFAQAGAKRLAVWAEAQVSLGVHDDAIRDRVVSDFDALAGPPPEAAVISWSADGQIDVRLAEAGGRVFSVWSDPSQYSVSGAVGDQLIRIDHSENDRRVGWPAIAAGGKTFLVAWRHDDRILAQRFELGGRPIDLEPLFLGVSEPVFGPYEKAPSIAFDGATFFIAWAHGRYGWIAEGKLSSALIGENGPPFGKRTLNLGESQHSGNFRAFHTRFGFMVVADVTLVQTQAHYDSVSTWFFRFGDALDTAAPQIVKHSSRATTRDALATSAVADDRFSHVWYVDFSHLQLTQTMLDGTSVAGTHTSVQPGLPPTDIVWNGGEYVLVWTDSDNTGARLRGLRFDAKLQRIDGAPFEIAKLSTLPAIVRTPAGIRIGYVRLDATHGVPRAFARTLDRVLPPQSRGRAVRR